MDQAIIQYARKAYNLLIGERTAEGIKIAVGSAFPLVTKVREPTLEEDALQPHAGARPLRQWEFNR